MHIPSEMLVGPVCPVTAAVAIAGVGIAVASLFKHKNAAPSAGRFALVGGVVFGLQMLNYPVFNGISGHLIAGVFAASILGVPAGVLSMALVLTLQTLLFADGGLTMLGANVVNMALLGAGVGGLLRQMLMKRNVKSTVATGVAAAVSVELAVLALCVQLAVSGKANASAIGTLVAVHTVLAVIEGFATALLVKLCAFSGERASSRSGYAVLSGLVIACIAAAPFASVFPDAFEWTMARFHLLPNAPAFTHAPFADYSVAVFSNEFISAFSAGALGVAVVMLVAFAMLLPVAGRNKD